MNRIKENAMNSTLASTSTSNPDLRRSIIRWFVRELMGVVMMGVILFVSAGRLDWPMAWLLLALTLIWALGTAAVTIPRCPELLAERRGLRKGAKTWDIALMSTVGVLELVYLVIAGLDVRYGWTSSTPLPAQLIALAGVAFGYGLFVWAIGSNAYFSQIVRIQRERGHTVRSSGPYRTVRHPAYVGAVIRLISSPILLGSWPALIASGAAAVLMVIRTALEDRTLLAELDGYRDYAGKVRCRLLPGVW
jgi:protein-S-isoprenylcysteine O-methyltransferase Ste14